MNLFNLAATLTLDTKGFERGVAQAQATMKSVSSGISNFGKGMTSIGKNISSFGQGMVRVGKAASVVTAGAVTVLGLAFNKAKQFIGTYESAMTVFSRKLKGGKEAAGQLYDGLVKIAKGSSFAQEHMVSAGQTLVAMGLDADKTQKYIQATTDAIAGMGGTGEEVEEMATLFGKLSQQTNLYTGDIQQMVEQGIPAWDILATKYHKTTDEVKDMARKGLLPAAESLDTITDALEESDEASEMFKYSVHGLAAELKSGTLTGTLDSLNTSFRTFSLRLLDLDPRTESGKENIKKLNNAISKFGEVLEKVGEKFGKVVGKDLVNGLDAVTNCLDNFNNALDRMSPEQAEAIVHAIEAIAIAGPTLIVVGTAIKWIGDAIAGLGTLFNGLSGAVTACEGGFSALAGAVGGVGTACAIVAVVIAALIAVFTVVKENWDKVVAAFSEWYENSGIKDHIDNLKQKFAELGEKLGTLHDLFTVWGTYLGAILLPVIILVQGVLGALVTFFEWLVVAITGVVDVLAGFGTMLMGIFTGDWEKVQEGFNQFLTGIGEILAGAFMMILGTLVSFLESTWAAIEGWFNELGIGEWLGNIWNNISTWFTTLISDIGNWLTNIWTGFTNWCQSLWNGLISWLANIIASIVAWCQNIWNTVKDKWNAIKESITQSIMQVYNNVRSWVDRIKSTISEKFNAVKSTVMNIWNNITSSVSNAVNNIWNTVTNIFNNVVNSIRNAMNNASSAVSSIIDRIKGFFNFNISWPKIPVPQFHLNPPGWKIGDLLQGSIPSLSISWHAKGGIFTKPTLFETAGGLHGVGEAGAEAVLPIKVLKDYVREAMAEGVEEAQITYKDSASAKANAGMINALLSTLNGKEQEINVYIGGKKIASEIYEPLMDIMKKKEVRVGA